MAEKKISELNSLTGANAATGDLLPIVDVDANETKKITRAELFTSVSGLTTTGDVTVGGDLTVNGTTTTINTQTLDVEDKNITVAFGAPDAASADGAGLTVDGANATFTYVSSGDNWAFNKDVDVTGDITVSGTVDGRDVAADGSKLDGIEAGADVTDTANVTAAGALMDSELTDEAAVKALDQGVATTDDPTFTNTQLAAIAETKAVTAVDVFVYDTSKDSDGGAWRKRTQHTSWYNETLNTATRGSRREFPAVAVIVADNNKITIYDGDDPTLPMWMVFEAGLGVAKYLSRGSGGSVVGLSAQNGIVIAITEGSTSSVAYDGLCLFNFAADTAERYSGSGASYVNPVSGLSNRNTQGYPSPTNADRVLVNNQANDVAMTVLPDAPIDPATGLPVPTIAVATDGGVSVIRDDGTVVDVTSTGSFSSVGFSDANRIVSYQITTKDVQTYSIPTSDASFSTGGVFSGGISDGNYYREGYIPPIMAGGSYVSGQTDLTPTYAGEKIAFSWREASGSEGIGLLLEDVATQGNGIVAKTTSTYNTGWMNGDIKGAFLSDTDDTDLVGSGELVTNGDFGTGDLTGWTDSSIGTGTATVNGSNQLELYRLDVSNRGIITQNITFTSGVLYVVTFTKIDSSANIQCKVGNSNPDIATNLGQVQAAGQYSFTFSSTQYLHFLNVSNGTTAVIDNVSVKLADNDRSVNNKGLIVNGTVTRTAVATGADLVAYSGFSASNYLEQPYNSDLDFGTGDFCVMGWARSNTAVTSTQSLVSIDDGTYSFRLGRTTVSGVTFTKSAFLQIVGVGGSLTLTSGIANSVMDAGVWNHLAVSRSSGVTTVWFNGAAVATSSAAYGDFVTTGSTLKLGSGFTLVNYEMAMALWRISATAPTAEQIKKIYEDEKFLFQDNAQATLYGASDAVTALAHDPVTDLLHVGTSAGRSVFSGLRRVSNTTTAVGTAISASNGLVAEE